jgi:soluble lytic murein transglycosylase
MNRRQSYILAAALLLLLPLIWAATRLTGRDPRTEEPVASSAEASGATPGVVKSAPTPAEAAAAYGVDLPPDVARLLREGRNWRASRRLRELVKADSNPELVLVAARANAAWGAWDAVRSLLDGKPWLDRAGGGDGWYLLARAREEERRWADAADAYERYLRARPAGGAPGAERTVAELRHALVLLRAGRAQEGIAALGRMSPGSSSASPWASLLAAEALAPAGDTAQVRRLLGRADQVPTGRAAGALVEAYTRARAPGSARAGVLALEATSEVDRAAQRAAAGRAALAAGDTAAARADFRAALAAAPTSGGAGDAAEGLERAGGLTPADRMALAETWLGRNRPARAAAQFRAWLAAGGGTPAERGAVQLRMGRALFAAGEHADAAAALAPLAAMPAPTGPQALYFLGRARLRGAPGSARDAFAQLASRFPTSPQAADGLYLMADLDDDAGRDAQAAAAYRQVVERHPSSPRAALASMRLGGAAMLRGDAASAARLWDGLRARTEETEGWAQATYWAGRAHHAAGNAAGARERWSELRTRAPVSYYTVLAARRLNTPYWPAALADSPPVDRELATRMAAALGPADLLREAGLHADAEAEVDRVVRTAPEDKATRYALGEALASRGWTVHGVRIARALEAKGEKPNARLLRVLYPLQYRPVFEAEARERGLDLYLVAALTRQESVFRPRAHSPVGARGLMQVMPATGRGLAAGAGITGWDPEMLFNPEINVHLGIRFLAAQMRAYDGNLPYVFSAYNAGPARVTRWRNFPEARDPELFTERIPFEETRDYVKILTRNIALYRGLYGG